MSLWDRVVEIANRAMQTEAAEILGELKEACPSRTGKTAASFHIMAGKGNATVSVGGKGLITSVRIGSTKLSALYASEGNGGSGRVITSTRPLDRRGRPPGKLKLSDGSYRTMVHGYTPPTNFVVDVANRHR